MTDTTFATGEQVREYGERATETSKAFGRQAIDAYEQVVKSAVDFEKAAADAAPAGVASSPGSPAASRFRDGFARTPAAASATTAVLSAASPAFFVCFAITSRRCFSRRRDSRHSLNAMNRRSLDS